MSLEGQQLGEFEILERLGQGGMGAVYKARQTSLDRLVALKTLQASLAEDAEYIARFRQEAKAAAGLNHPNLVQVYSAGENEGLHWFAMEYVEGESAKARLKRKGRLDPLEAIAIVIHVATALEYGWRKAQLIHRDIKPDNIFPFRRRRGEARRPGPGQERGAGAGADHDRRLDGHAALHQPRAGGGDEGRGSAGGHLQPRLHALSLSQRPAALRRQTARWR